MNQPRSPAPVEADLDFCPFGAEPTFAPPRYPNAGMGVYTLDPYGYVLGWRPLSKDELRDLWTAHEARHGWYTKRGVA